jgi:hypothetical protein
LKIKIMQSIVINSCYGGFSLSPLAVKELAKLNGKECYYFVHDVNYQKYIPATKDQINKNFLLFCFSVLNPNDYSIDSSTWAKLSQEERIAINKRMDSISLDDRDIPRDDKNLIKVVKKLGEKANGSHAKLRIVQIPDGIQWEIEEYDGIEHVAEKHKVWS